MSDDDKVGYGKPPKHSQFRKGCSGNPKDRPKGAKNLKTELEEELRERIVVREGGKPKKVTKLRAIIKGQTAKGAHGDTKAATFVGNLVFKLLDTGANEPLAEDVSEDDLAILDDYVKRRQATAEDENPTGDTFETDGEGAEDTEGET